jgi:hypothetical protein
MNVSGEDASGRGPGGGRGADGDDAVWRDLVARFDLPAADQAGAAPWPDRESLTPPARDQESAGQVPGADRARVIRPAAPSAAGPEAPLPPAGTAERGAAGLADAEATADDLADAAAPAGGPADTGLAETGLAETEATGRGRYGAGRLGANRADDDADEHFIPPPPPPLPHLDPVAKGAWTALFGGPAYLLWATLMGWVIPGWAALLAVMAFVGGFAAVVLRLGERPSDGDDGDEDDGAVL